MAVGLPKRQIRGKTAEFLRALARSRFGVCSSLTEPARLLFSDMPAKFKAIGFEARMRRHRREWLTSARVPSGTVTTVAASGVTTPATAGVPVAAAPPEHERIFDRSLLVKLAPEFASVKKRAMQLTGCE